MTDRVADDLEPPVPGDRQRNFVVIGHHRDQALSRSAWHELREQRRPDPVATTILRTEDRCHVSSRPGG